MVLFYILDALNPHVVCNIPLFGIKTIYIVLFTEDNIEPMTISSNLIIVIVQSGHYTVCL